MLNLLSSPTTEKRPETSAEVNEPRLQNFNPERKVFHAQTYGKRPGGKAAHLLHAFFAISLVSATCALAQSTPPPPSSGQPSPTKAIAGKSAYSHANDLAALSRAGNVDATNQLALAFAACQAESPTNASSSTHRNQNDLVNRSWQIEGFASGGFVPSFKVYQPPGEFPGFYIPMRLDFASAGFEAGRMVTAPHGPGILRGRGEALIEIIPFWLADYPKQTLTWYYTNGQAPIHIDWLPLRVYGASVTPVLFRWNFVKVPIHASPWAQLGGGLLWTNRKFPDLPFLTSDTSVINFTPQLGVGENFFLRKSRSLDFAVKAVHISNAGLGDHNPGLNVTLQFSAGYSWWK